MISEYAAYVVLHHNRMYHGRLQDEVYETKPETTLPAIMPTTEASSEENNGGSSASSTAEDLSTLAEVLGLTGFAVEYTGYDTIDSYKDEYFNFTATSGRTLFVLHFDITNMGEQEAEADVLKSQLRFRCVVNREKRVSSQLTMLVNDLYSFRETIGPSQKKEAILIFQLPGKYENAVESIELSVKGDDGNHKYILK